MDEKKIAELLSICRLVHFSTQLYCTHITQHCITSHPITVTDLWVVLFEDGAIVVRLLAHGCVLREAE